VKPSTDYDLIRRICTDERIYDLLTDDLTPDDFVLSDNFIYLISDSEDGTALFIPKNGIEVEFHIAVLPEAKGRAFYYAKRAISWVFNANFMKVTAMVPFTNRQAYRFAIKLGFKEEGINTMSFLKNGKLHDQWFMGLTKEDWACHF